MLRRTYASKDSHGQPIVALPQREVIVQRVAFSPAEQEFYAQLLQRTRAVFNEFVLQGIVKSRYAMILSLLLSLRQACDHPFLLLGRAQGLLRRKDEEELEKAINEAPFQAPVCPVYQNVDAKPYTDPAQIKANLIAQLTAPVRWTYIVKNMLADGVTEFTELGPGTVLQGLIKKVNPEATVESKSTL